MEYGDKGGKRTTLILLGTGTPNAEPSRAGPAAAVVVGEQPYVVDFGPGVVRSGWKCTALRAWRP